MKKKYRCLSEKVLISTMRAYRNLLTTRINVYKKMSCRNIFFELSSPNFCDLLKSSGRLNNKVTIANIIGVMEGPLMKADEKEGRGGQGAVAFSDLMSCSCYFVWYWQSVFEWNLLCLYRHVLHVPSYIAVCLFWRCTGLGLQDGADVEQVFSASAGEARL
jgi:hypothetical protein